LELVDSAEQSLRPVITASQKAANRSTGLEGEFVF
jgi:hypothetical protein